MYRFRMFLAVTAGLFGLSGCAFISPDLSVEALKANAETQTSFQINLPPDQACAKTARMLMWCAGGPNFHYRCDNAPGGARSELSGTLEAIYRTEYFMVTEFAKGPAGTPAGTTVTVRQRNSILVHDYAPIIEKYFTKPDCQPR